jgi:hypothetical protein
LTKKHELEKMLVDTARQRKTERVKERPFVSVVLAHLVIFCTISRLLQ